MKEITLKCGAVTLVSDVDYDWLREHKWRANYHTASGNPYVCTDIARKKVYMQRLITKCPPTMKADHRDRDTLNNQRGNLRVVTFHENNANRQGFGRSGLKGVAVEPSGWRARITFEGETRSLGTFKTAREAGQAYDAAAFRLFGEFAYLNFPEDYPTPIHDFPEIPFP